MGECNIVPWAAGSKLGCNRGFTMGTGHLSCMYIYSSFSKAHWVFLVYGSMEVYENEGRMNGGTVCVVMLRHV